jgi:ferredoxin-NADP reductase
MTASIATRSFAPTTDRVIGLARSVVASRWLRPLGDEAAIDDLLGQVNPLWSLNRVRARVERVVDETADAKTFVLRPNRHWRGFKAGQHVVVDVEINGARHQRAYSLSSDPADRSRVSITVKRQAGGRVSNALHHAIKVGDVLGLSAATGDFTLPAALPRKLLLLGAGSGVTPLMSMLHALHGAGYDGDVVFVHASRNQQDAIFSGALRSLVMQWSGLRWIEHHSDQQGRLDAATLAQNVPDLADRQTFLCGPLGFIDWVDAEWQARGIADKLAVERFGAPVAKPRIGDAPVEIDCVKSERSFSAAGTQSLLVEAEAAGLNPKYGCRAGICASCTCRKQSGTVENLLTGEVSDAPDELIRLCVSVARSDVRLAL